MAPVTFNQFKDRSYRRYHWKIRENRWGVMTLKSYLLLAILIVSFSAVSCFHPATPDDDLASGVILGDIVAVQQALDRGANASKIYENGMTPLMYACVEYKHLHGESGGNVSVSMKLDFDNSKKTSRTSRRLTSTLLARFKL